MLTLLIQTTINAVLQVILFAFIPLVWWFVTARKQVKFTQWIGLKKIQNGRESKVILWVAGVAVLFAVFGLLLLRITKDAQMATSDFAGMGAYAVPAILVYAILNTSLSEELFFRGFFFKRMQAKFGFQSANIDQAILFGIIHGYMFFGMVGVVKGIIITVFTGAIAWMMGYINEQKAGGSILPSWMIHALANIFSGLCSAFLLI